MLTVLSLLLGILWFATLADDPGPYGLAAGLIGLRHIGAMGYPAAGAGGVTTLLLPRSALWHRIHLQLRNTITVTTGGGTALTEEPQSLLRSIEVIANGSNVIKRLDGGTLYRVNQFHHGQPAPRDALGGTATGEVNVHFVLDFSMPRAVMPIDTIFDARKWAVLELSLVWGNENDIVGSATGTWDFSDLVVDVAVEELSPIQVNAGIFRESMLSRTYTALTGEQDVDLAVGDFYRALTLKTIESGNPSDGLVELVTLFSGGSNFFQGVGWGDTDAAAQLRGTLNGYNSALFPFGDGSSGGPPVGYRRLEFAPEGVLRGSLDTGELEELTLRANLGQSAATGTLSVVSHTIVNPERVRA